MQPSGEDSDQTGTPRRFVLAKREVPGLLLCVLRGERVGLRRVLGARGTGRIGIGLALGALVIAVPLADWPAVLAAHGGLSLAAWGAVARRAGLGLRQHQRLLLWAVAPTLAASAPLRLFVEPGWVAPVTAVLASQALLGWHLGRPAPFGPACNDDPV